MTPLLIALFFACNSGSVGTDAGLDDSGSTDGGATDGGSSDGGTTDGGTTDGGTTDGGSGDGGTTDNVQASDVTAWVDDTIGSLVYVSWEQAVAGDVWVEYRVVDEDWRSSPVRAEAAGTVEQLLLGLPYAVDIEYRVANDFGDGALTTDSFAITTDDTPADLPIATLVSGDAASWDPDVQYVFTAVNGSASGYSDIWSFIVDRQGRPVWAWETVDYRITLHPRLSHDGRELLIDYNSYWYIYDGGDASQVARLQLDGTVVELIDTPGLHHPYTELADHSILYGSAVSTLGEDLVQRHPDGSFNTLWSCEDWRSDNGIGAYCGSNTIWWDEATDHILYSFYSIETVVEIDLASNEAVRWFGHADGSWEFDGLGSAFWWQHGAYFTDAGTLLLSSKDRDNGNETVWREYSLDEDSETLTQIASFGDGEGVYGDVMGEAHRLGNGNTLHNYGSAPRLREITPDGAVVWDLSWSADFIGRSTPIGDLYEMAY